MVMESMAKYLVIFNVCAPGNANVVCYDLLVIPYLANLKEEIIKQNRYPISSIWHIFNENLERVSI